jgi:hypothetical protein
MNRDRRKILASIFADTAKYSLTAGVVGAVISGKISFTTVFTFGLITGIFCLLAYFVTPKDKDKDRDKDKEE